MSHQSSSNRQKRPVYLCTSVDLPPHPARRQSNVTGLWREMRVEGICRSPQKMSDHRVAHIFRTARAFTPKPQHIALSPGWVRTVKTACQPPNSSPISRARICAACSACMNKFLILLCSIDMMAA